MQISVLASGSSGNCTYIESGESKILIDAGISMRRIKKNLVNHGIDLSEINGVFVTHEHTDHVYALPQLSKQNIPIFMNRATLNSLEFPIQSTIIPPVYKFRDLIIKQEPVSHDATDPVGYVIKENGTSVGVFTDLGKIDDNIRKAVAQATCLVMESNHDLDMVMKGPYPYHLKQRILSEKGHLSNIEASLLIKENASPSLKNVFLSHISLNNNTPELAYRTFTELNSGLNGVLTSQKPSELIRF
jgi:phosphoribosyl 1,2-cyclic phosphodiesterase